MALCDSVTLNNLPKNRSCHNLNTAQTHLSLRKFRRKDESVHSNKTNGRHTDPIIILNRSEISNWYSNKVTPLKRNLPSVILNRLENIPTYTRTKNGAHARLERPKRPSRTCVLNAAFVKKRKAVEGPQIRKSTRLNSPVIKKKILTIKNIEDLTSPVDDLGRKLRYTYFLGLSPVLVSDPKDRFRNVLLVDKTIFCCRICKQTYSSKTELYKHENTHLCCDVCNKRFDNLSLLQSHSHRDVGTNTVTPVDTIQILDDEDDDVIWISDNEDQIDCIFEHNKRRRRIPFSLLASFLRANMKDQLNSDVICIN